MPLRIQEFENSKPDFIVFILKYFMTLIVGRWFYFQNNRYKRKEGTKLSILYKLGEMGYD